MDLMLKDKVAVITGGSVGIGLAVAEALAAEGVDLALCARNEERLSAAGEHIREAHGVRVLTVPADVTKAADITAMAQQIEKEFGGADILINNAGTGSEEKIMDAPDDKWQRYWDLHVMAAVRMSRAIVPLMRKRGGGVIINNDSICAKQPLGYEPIYNTTKAALARTNVVCSKGTRHNHLRSPPCLCMCSSRPGKPQDNALIEASNSRFRQECLNEHWFLSVADAQEKVDAWRNHYNAKRPHSALGNLSPEDFVHASAATATAVKGKTELAILT